MDILIDGLIFAGACLLTASLVPVRDLMAQLPGGRVRSRWRVLTALIILFILGYLVFATFIRRPYREWTDLVVPLIFFFGGCFVLMINYLSLQTALDVRRISTLEQENVTDPLTGLYNRRHLERQLKEEAARARRYDLPLSVLMIDLDGFKSTNDTYGHHVGDLVLCNLANTLMKTVRDSDLVARHGGDEIVVVAPNTALQSAATLAERLRAAVADAELAPPSDETKGRAVQLTISVGVAALGAGTPDSRSLLQSADAALYQAKHGGRDRVASDG